ncbi:lipopolysaccharide biosynthesis protein [Paraglaciecola sp. 2405UD69-4]|uniref:lipopolysaccharide biosynthesis protein n=1 Tax=Paraglaciecola sp. 2405UD69-4 TaxID=3391836 RepID=UPI0039C9AFC4
MATFKKALIFSFAEKYLRIILQLVSVTILARLITPEEYGIYTIAVVFVGIASIIKELGVNNYLIKEQDLTTDKIRSAYGVLIIVATFTALILFLSSSFIADFYTEQTLSPILKLLAFNILIAPYGSIIQTLQRKELNFQPSFVTGLLSQLISVIMMIGLAINDFGVYTLVWGAIIQTATQALLIQFYRPKSMPALPNLKLWKEITGYSSFVSLNAVAGHIGHNSAELITGKFLSITDVGILNRASNTAGLFNNLFTQALGPVVTPFFAKLKAEKGDITRSFKTILQIQLSIAWPFYIVLGLFSELIIRILFGEQWLAAAPLLSLYCISRSIYFVTQLAESILMGLGEAKSIMKAGLLLNSLRVIIALIFAPYGLTTLVTALVTIPSLIRLAIYFYLIKTKIHITSKNYISWLKSPFIISIFTLTPYLVFSMLPFASTSNMLSALVTIIAMGIIWLFMVFYSEQGQLLKKQFLPSTKKNIKL